MELGTYLLIGIVEATTPPNETAADAQSRRAAIVEMVEAYDPADAKEGMIVCQCIMLQFMVNGAMRDAHNTCLEPKVLARNRAAALSISRTLLQWVTKLENARKRNEARAAAAVEQALAPAATVAAPRPVAANQRPPQVPATPSNQPRPTPASPAPASHAPLSNGRTAAPSGDWPSAVADGLRSGAAGQVPAVPAGDRKPVI
jgi:hypothetical protein